MDGPELIAHRGYTLHYPENTRAALSAAIAAGARHVEVDVQLTRDEVPVLFHDDSLERLCGVRGAVHDRRAAELAELHASDFERFGYRFAAEPVATLADLAALLAAHPQVTAFVELKGIALNRFGIALVLARVREILAPVARQCVLISYDLEALEAARGHGGMRIGIVIDRWRERRQPIVARIRPDYLFCDVAGLPWFGRLAYPGAKLAVFEVADAARALRLARRGVQLIETFAIGELRAALALAAPR